LISLYLLAASGHDIAKYPDFWHRQMMVAASHTRAGTIEPRDRERLEIMNQIIDSIEKKRARGAFIFPEEYLAGNTYEVQLMNFAGNVKLAEKSAE